MAKDHIYDAVISLGRNCTPAHNIRYYFNQTAAYPFDWWISDLEPAIAVLKSRFTNLFEADDLIITDAGMSVVSKRYWIRYFHDFPRVSKDGKIASNFKDHAAAASEKYARRIQRLFETANNRRVLFVRHGGVNGQAEDDSNKRLDNVFRLYDALINCIPLACVDLLVVDGFKEEMAPIQIGDGHILFEKFPPSVAQGHDWRVPEYKALWPRLGIKLRSGIHAT